MRSIQLIVIHCSATRCDRRSSLEDLIACHDARFGFTGYHWYITKDGTTYQTRHENLPGAPASMPKQSMQVSKNRSCVTRMLRMNVFC